MRTPLTLLAFSLWLFAGVASAADGVVELSQAEIVDSGGFPHVISAPGSYVLTSDLVVSGASLDAVQITAADVTLDLNGFSLRGPVNCSGTAPSISCGAGSGRGVVSNAPRTSVQDGKVTGFGGLGVELTDESRVERLVVAHNGGGGIVVGNICRVSGTSVDGNAGIGLAAGNDCLVLQNAVRGNNATGMQLGAGSGFVENVVNSNGTGSVTGGVPLGQNTCDRAPDCSVACADVDSDDFFGNCTPLDCDDAVAASFPGASEICDMLDNDCDGSVDEDFDLNTDDANCGVCSNACNFDERCATGSCVACTDDDLDGYYTDCNPMDCNDADSGIHPAAVETCDGVDQDCNGLVDDGIAPQPSSCGIGACSAAGQIICSGGSFQDTCTPGTPDPDDSVCNGIDDDCDGQIDEDVNLNTDPQNCGTCGNACGMGEVCTAGTCT